MPLPPKPGIAADRDLRAALLLVEQLRPAMERGDRARQVDIIGKLADLRAPMGGQWEELASIAARNAEFGIARKAIDLFAEAGGGGAAGDYRKAALLFELGFPQEADALLRALPDDVPDAVSNAYSRGVVALNLGDVDETRRNLEQVTLARPGLGSAWLLLSAATNFANKPELAARVLAAEPIMEDVKPAERGLYYYALGKVRSDLGEHAAAFAAYARGAAQMKAIIGFDPERDRAEAEEAVRGYSFERIAAIAAQQQEPTERTIFVTGLPRSGTTLVEQILTSHSLVSDGAEIHLLSLLARDLGGPSFPRLERYVKAQGTTPAVRLWDHWLDERFPAPGRIVNKALDTSRSLGLAAALLPDAPLIWMTRDPLDRAWSCFRTNFHGGAQPWSYDLEDIAAHFRLEDELLAQWQDILGERLLVVPYEDLVDDPASWIGRILSHCGLDEEPGVFSPHENRRAVSTASATQVRRPINRDGIGSSEPYREFLKPFIDAYYG